jgi:hypothetical protein
MFRRKRKKEEEKYALTLAMLFVISKMLNSFMDERTQRGPVSYLVLSIVSSIIRIPLAKTYLFR